MNATNRVALNTGILYGRMILTVGITLYATRLVLNGLGSIDYGVFNVIAGAVFILSFLNTAMATSTQRYLSFYEGKKDLDMQKNVFNNSLLLHAFLGIAIVLGLEIAGLFLFDGFLNIPANRLAASKIVYHLTSATVFFTILSVPFNASLIAHENMLWVAVTNIVESILKLLIAVALFHIAGDRLVFYGVFTAIISVISFLMYAFYCFRYYDECRISRNIKKDKVLMKELASNAGWNLFGVLGGIGKNQGMAILLNVFFGPVVNASFAIANQVSGQLNFFSGTMLRAINPQIMKSEGDGNRERMVRLSLLACKYCFLLLAVIAIPCIFEMTTILTMWLKNVPLHAVEFCTLILVAFMVNQLTMGLDSAAQATGKIKTFMILVGCAKLLIVPMGYVLLVMGYDIYSVFIAYILLEALGGVFRIYSVNKLIDLSYSHFMKTVILPLILPLTITLFVDYLIVKFFSFSFRILFTISVSSLVMIMTTYIFSFSGYEKETFKKFISKFTKKIKPQKAN